MASVMSPNAAIQKNRFFPRRERALAARAISGISRVASSNGAAVVAAAVVVPLADSSAMIAGPLASHSRAALQDRERRAIRAFDARSVWVQEPMGCLRVFAIVPLLCGASSGGIGGHNENGSD